MIKVKEENEKVGLKLNIQKTKIMASSPITSWKIDGKTVETVRDFILLFRSYFHQFIFKLTDSFFCFRYFVTDSF